MKKIVLIVVGIIVVLIAFGSRSGYNKLGRAEEGVKTKWNQVEINSKRHSDLIPDLINTVKEASKLEQTTFTQVIEAPYKAKQITVDRKKLTAENIFNGSTQFFRPSSTNLISISFCINGQVFMLN